MKAMIGDLQSQIDSRQAKQVAMVRKLLASAQNAEQPAGALLVEPVPLVATANEDRETWSSSSSRRALSSGRRALGRSR